jgi:hypothetical protein
MVWKLEDGSFFISGIPSTILAGNFEGYIKDVTRAGGERDAELLRTMGNYQYWDPKNTNVFEFNATCIGSTATFEMMLLGGSVTTGQYMGSAVEKWPRILYDFHLMFTDSTVSTGPMMKISCLSSYVTNVGMKGSNTDSLEETVTWKTLPCNYRKQYTQNRTGSPIV